MIKLETEDLVKKAVAGLRQALETVVKQIQPPVYSLNSGAESSGLFKLK